MASGKETAEEITHTLEESVSEFVVAQGLVRLQALQTTAHAMDARVTQVATLLFAAAALAASVIGTAFSPSAILALMATAMFIWGGLMTFRGIRSDAICLPGIPPAWWVGALSQTHFTNQDARAWAAGLIQDAIEKVDLENEERAKTLNASLRCACVAAVLVGFAAAAKIPLPN